VLDQLPVLPIALELVEDALGFALNFAGFGFVGEPGLDTI